MSQAQLPLRPPLQEYPLRHAETNPLEEMMKTFMAQNNPLSRNKKKFNGGRPPRDQPHAEQEEPKKE
jgi:hypothetical protein